MNDRRFYIAIAILPVLLYTVFFDFAWAEKTLSGEWQVTHTGFSVLYAAWPIVLFGSSFGIMIGFFYGQRYLSDAYNTKMKDLDDKIFIAEARKKQATIKLNDIEESPVENEDSDTENQRLKNQISSLKKKLEASKNQVSRLKSKK
jgi:hypothetical protein